MTPTVFIIKNTGTLKENIFNSFYISPGEEIDVYKSILGSNINLLAIISEHTMPGTEFSNAILARRLQIIQSTNPRAAGAPRVERARTTVDLFDDFLTDTFTGSENFSARGSGGAQIASHNASTVLAGAAGVVVSQVTNPTAFALHFATAGGVSLGFGRTRFEGRFRAGNTASATGQEFRVEVGLSNAGDVLTDPTFGVYFANELDGNQFWKICAIDGAIVLKQQTTAPIMRGAWNNFTIDIDEDGNNAEFQIDDVSIGTLDISSLGKDETNKRFSPYTRIQRLSGTGNRLLFTDYIGFKKSISR